jgi:hypothetical protein
VQARGIYSELIELVVVENVATLGQRSGARSKMKNFP